MLVLSDLRMVLSTSRMTSLSVAKLSLSEEMLNNEKIKCYVNVRVFENIATGWRGKGGVLRPSVDLNSRGSRSNLTQQ